MGKSWLAGGNLGCQVLQSSLLLLVLPDQQELGIGYSAILVHIQLRYTPLCLCHLVSSEVSRLLNYRQHFIFSNESTIVDIHCLEFFPNRCLCLSIPPDGSP